MGLKFLKIAVVYLFVGACLGLGMGITQKFTLVPVHAHLLLLGWASLALAGVVYHFYPAASTTRMARVHFWLHNAAVPVMMSALSAVLLGHQQAIPFLVAAEFAAAAGILVFAANIFTNVKMADARQVR